MSWRCGASIPAIAAGVDLRVGLRLAIGDHAVIELTEANKPCYRLNCLAWAAAAQKAYGDGSKWYNAEACPLSREGSPGGRGWLAKVITEGEVRPGDVVRPVAAAPAAESTSGGAGGGKRRKLLTAK